MHVCFTQIKERETAAPGDSLLAKAVLCAVSVAKTDRVQGRPATNCAQRKIGISVAALNGLLW